MDGSRFDALTRRLLVAGAAGGALAALLDAEPAAAKRCKRGRTRCAGRCCPRGYRCEGGRCIRACPFPGDCAGARYLACGGFFPTPCACARTLSGGSACVQIESILGTCTATDPQPCDAATPCPAGELCVAACCTTPARFRCFAPCPGPFP